MKELIKKVVEGHNLTRGEAGMAMDSIMCGEATPSQIAALLVALHTKVESIDEITGFAEKMREHSVKIYPKRKDLVDTCGTGGDHSGTFNISTVSAIVASGAGAAIAKHGNRSVSSKCGSADLLEALGVKIDLEPKSVEECIDETGFGFIYAPNFHKAMKFAGPTRKEIGISTVFNILGPLTNPANAGAQLLGVFHDELTDIMSNVLKNLGAKEALVVHSNDGLDEISVSEKTKVSHLKNGKVETRSIKPEDFGFVRSSKEELSGKSVEENTKIALNILTGAEKGAKRDIVLINAGAAIYLGGKAKDIREGIDRAKESIDTGAAGKKLDEIVKFTKGR